MILRRHRYYWVGILAIGTLWPLFAGCAREPEVPPPNVTRQIEAPTQSPPTATRIVLPTPTEILPTATPTPVTPVQGNALNLIQTFVDAPFRVVMVAKSPYAPYSLIIATERSAAECGSAEAPQRCTADDTCGSFYTSPACYFFVEPSFDATADPATRYVSRWPEEPTVSALAVDSLRFIDARTVEFRAAGGDGAYSVEEVWWLDLVTGALAMQSRVEQGGGAP